MEDFSTKYFRGRGKLFLGDLDANYNPSNLLFIGDVTSADLTPDVQRDEIIQNIDASGAVGASWKNATRINFSAAVRSIRHDHLALALQGSDNARPAASVTDELHTANLDSFFSLHHARVSAVTVTNVGGAVTYTEGAGNDYVLHADDGLIEVLSGGSITEGQQLEVDYTHVDQHHIKVETQTLKKSLVFAGVNAADDGKYVRCAGYKIELDPSALSMITDSATDMAINGTLEIVPQRPAGDQLYSWIVED